MTPNTDMHGFEVGEEVTLGLVVGPALRAPECMVILRPSDALEVYHYTHLWRDVT